MKLLTTQLTSVSLALLLMMAVKNQAGTVYQNNFIGGTNALAGFTTFGQFAGPADVANGQLELFSPWSSSRIGVSLDISSLPGYSSSLSDNSEIVEWAFNLSNADAQYNNGFFFVPAMDSADPFGSVRGYALRGGEMVGNRMYLSRFDSVLNGPETILIDVPDALGLGPLPQVGAVRITFRPSSRTWSLYIDKGPAYTDPRAVMNLVGTAVDDTYTHVPLPYMSMGGEGTGTDYFDNVSITVGSAFVRTNVLLPGDSIIASSTNSPVSEGVGNAIDGTEAKYVNFDSGLDAKPCSFVVTPSSIRTLVTGIAMKSANDAPDRDPLEITLEGSNDSTVSSFDSGNWEPIVHLNIPSWESIFGVLSSRYQTQTFSFQNTNAYEHYRWTVLHTQGPSPCCMQIAEVELLGYGVLAPQTVSFSLPSEVVITNSPLTLTATASSGLPVTFTVASGPATLDGDQLVLTGTGEVTVQAEQEGSSQYQAVAVLKTLSVTAPIDGSLVIVKGPVINPQNNHWYYLLAPKSWSDAEAAAVTMGGHLVTVNDQDEQRWLADNFLGFSGVAGALWIGLWDPQPYLANDNSWAWTQHFLWASGQPVTFFCWSATSSSQGRGRIKMFSRGEWGEEADWVLLNAVVEVPPPLEITSQPQSISAGIGCAASFTVLADGISSIQYQWQFMGTNLPGQTQSTLSLTNLKPAQTGPYSVIVSSANGMLTSTPAMLSVAGIVGWGEPGFGNLDVPASATNIVAISSGGLHSLALKADGTVVAWGDDRAGQIDVPAGLPTVVGIAAAGFFSLALKADGTVTGWGENVDGQLNGPADLTNVVRIATADTFSLALKSDGKVVGWGDNRLGQLDIPADLTNAVRICAGDSFSLALKSDCTVTGWGDNSMSQLDIPAGLTDVVAIAAGGSHSLALRSDGTVAAWGYDFFGETHVPVGLRNVIAVAAGVQHSVALLADGTVEEWGWVNWFPPRPVQLPDVVAIAAGKYFNLALLRDGAAVSGQTNVPPVTDVRRIAGPIVNPANGHKYFLLEPATWTNAELAAVAMGGHLVTINNQDENTWVYNTFGSLIGVDGDLWIGLHLPDPSTASTDRWTRAAEFVWASGQPVTVQIWAQTNTIRSGYCRLHGPNFDPSFERGRWAEELQETPLNSVVELPAPIEIVVQPQNTSAGIGSDATLSVFADGSTPISYQWQCHGTNLPGQTTATLTLSNAQPSQSDSFSVIVSNASGTLTSAPALFSVVGIVAWGPGGALDAQLNIPPGLTSVRAIAAGSMHYLALRPDGTVVAWGDNRYNQLSVPADLTNVIAIAGAQYHSLALKADGTVVSWGYDVRTGNWVPSDLTNVVAVDADGYHNLALKADGTVVAWGGDGALPSVAPSGLTNVVAISAGDGHNLALKADGSVVQWWDTTGEFLVVPNGLTNVIAISGGTGDSFALKADGTVVAWGDDWYGQTEVPAGLTNVVSVSAKLLHSLALRADGTVVSWRGESVPPGLPNIVAIAASSIDAIALLRDGAPNMTVQPWDRSIPQGDSPSLVAKAVGMQSMNYQWQLDGTNIAGATSDTYSITNAQPVDAGLYTLTVSNEVGKLASRHAKLVVSPAVSIQPNHPLIAWSTPGSITYGTPLGEAQLNATADVPGTFVYSPPIGTILSAGSNQSLSVSFTPLDLTAYTPASATVNISVLPAPLSVTADNANRQYGNVNPSFSATILGFVNGDTSAVVSGSPSFSTAATSSSSVGTYAIVPSIGTLTVDPNYTFGSFDNAILTVNPANLTVSAGGLSANNKAYDGTTTATLSSNNVVLAGSVNADAANLWLVTNGYTATFASADVGNNLAITVSGLTLGGNAASNYTLAQPSGLTASITAPEPRIVATSLVGQTLQLSVPTVPGVNYVLEYKNSIMAPNWVADQTSAGNGGVLTFMHYVGTNVTGFYRIRIQ